MIGFEFASQHFRIPSSRIEARWDPNYYRLIAEFREKASRCRFPMTTLAPYLSLVQYGISERATDDSSGTPMLRMINLQNDTWDLSSLKYINMTNAESAVYLLKPGDILFNRTNSKELVGKCCVFDLPGSYVFASYLIRVRLRPNSLLPEYVTAYLSSPFGRTQLDAVSRQIAGMTNINAEEIRNLCIPIPNKLIQSDIAQIWKTAISKRDAAAIEARETLSAIDACLLERLGIPATLTADSMKFDNIFRRKFSVVSGQRFDAPAHRSKLSLHTKHYSMSNLQDLVTFNPRTSMPNIDPDDPVSFVPMDAICEDFGEIEYNTSRPAGEHGTYTCFQEDDIIWAKITPCMENGKSAVASNLLHGVGFGSTEFHVLRCTNPAVTPRYLHYIVRLKALRAHARNYFTGSSGHQRVDLRFFEQLSIPLPDRATQDRIVNELDALKKTARRLFEEAEQSFQAAKHNIETILLKSMGN